MSQPRLILIAVVALLACAQIFQAQSNNDAGLPAGTAQEKAANACLTCHDAHIIVQQRLSKAAWTKEVDKMTKWGAAVDPKDRDTLIEYLSSNFGVERPAYQPDRSSTSKSKK
jgi:hypothetical protein